MKNCYMCNVVQPLVDFGNNASLKDGKYAYCRKCAVGYQRSMYFKRTHGITIEQRDQMLASQGGICKICTQHIKFNTEKGAASNTSIGAVVDHCHTTNNIRGILCGACNTAIGLMKDDTARLQNAINYLDSSRA